MNDPVMLANVRELAERHGRTELAERYAHAADQLRKERREWGLCEHDQHAEHCQACAEDDQ